MESRFQVGDLVIVETVPGERYANEWGYRKHTPAIIVGETHYSTADVFILKFDDDKFEHWHKDFLKRV